MTTGRKLRTLEDRRATGELVTELPVIVGGRPTESELERPPASLDKWGKAAWREVAPLLVEAKLLDRVDRQALEAYALHMGRARALREAIEWEHEEAKVNVLDGTILNLRTMGKRVRRKTLDEQFRARTVRGYTSNPLLAQERDALREARMCAEELGLNPVSRTKLAKSRKERSGLRTLTDDLPKPGLRVVGEDA
jgi:P27 family predicted phage terminase small subunit